MRAKGYAIGADELSAREIDEQRGAILCRTRTGKKVHAAFGGSSVTICGHWLKFSAEQFRVKQAQVRSDTILCENCGIVHEGAVA